jgi:hypothetical protein
MTDNRLIDIGVARHFDQRNPQRHENEHSRHA